MIITIIITIKVITEIRTTTTLILLSVRRKVINEVVVIVPDAYCTVH